MRVDVAGCAAFLHRFNTPLNPPSPSLPYALVDALDALPYYRAPFFLLSCHSKLKRDLGRSLWKPKLFDLAGSALLHARPAIVADVRLVRPRLHRQSRAKMCPHPLLSEQ
jgi:hypothetical protein